MTENDQSTDPGKETGDEGPAASEGKNEAQLIQNKKEENPQKGSEWANYQTKELSNNEEAGGRISAEEAAEAFTKE